MKLLLTASKRPEASRLVKDGAEVWYSEEDKKWKSKKVRAIHRPGARRISRTGFHPVWVSQGVC